MMGQQDVYARAQALLQAISTHSVAELTIQELLFLTNQCRSCDNTLAVVTAFSENDLRALEAIVRRINSLSRVVRMLPR